MPSVPTSRVEIGSGKGAFTRNRDQGVSVPPSPEPSSPVPVSVAGQSITSSPITVTVELADCPAACTSDESIHVDVATTVNDSACSSPPTCSTPEDEIAVRLDSAPVTDHRTPVLIPPVGVVVTSASAS